MDPNTQAIHLQQRRERRKAYCKRWHQQHKSEQRQYRANNKERYKAWFKANKTRAVAKQREWVNKHRAELREKGRLWEARRRKDPVYRILANLRGRISSVMKGKRSKNTSRFIGCSPENFRIYIESRFEVGMTWQNYGRNGWHIDHIMPCAIFDLSKPEHQKRCFHFSNLQPMWAIENMSKGAKVLPLVEER